ncbi:hypothetical protein BSKO_04580 [Bryopsis sp. KO-2023]|nr:hypothetical protein BSKO_04580 [Bryopsis sp. KO-2023]
MAAATMGEIPSEFVRVKDGGFVVGPEDTEVLFVGANSYHLLMYAKEECKRPLIDQIFDTAKAAGMTVMRTWAFFDGDESCALQHSPGCFHEEAWIGLDYVIHAAAQRGLKLILVLTNYWPDFGGLSQYLKWTKEGSSSAEEFFECEAAEAAYMKYVDSVINRVNSFTGTMYKDDPAILAWSAINEPRCKGDLSCQKLKAFLGRVGAFIKSIDSNHLLTFDSEGFFGPSTPEFLEHNPYDTSGEGTDFCDQFNLPGYDFASIHMWPQNWGISNEQEENDKFIENWIESHDQASREILKMPLVVSEFGTREEKPKMFKMVLQHCSDAMVNKTRALHGVLFWHLATPEYPDYDRHNVYTCEEMQSALLALEHPIEPAEEFSGPAEVPVTYTKAPGEGETDGGSGVDHSSWHVLSMCAHFSYAVKASLTAVAEEDPA